MTDKTIQETTSTYFNYILNRDVVPLSVDQLQPEVVEEFTRIIESGFSDEAELVKRRFKYIIPYVLQSIDWDAYGIPLEAWQLRYYYQRERFLQKTALKYDDFLNHEKANTPLHSFRIPTTAGTSTCHGTAIAPTSKWLPGPTTCLPSLMMKELIESPSMWCLLKRRLKLRITPSFARSTNPLSAEAIMTQLISRASV